MNATQAIRAAVAARVALDRFMAKVSPEPNTGCWLWTAGLTSTGYGKFRHGPRRSGGVPASRAAWTLFVGEIPAGLWVLHRCDNPPCVNPEHLFLGTAGDNNRDTVKKRRNVVHNKRLTDQEVASILREYAAGALQRELAVKYGVVQTAISRYTRGDLVRPS